jgi:ATP-dependent Lhr-like helicase
LDEDVDREVLALLERAGASFLHRMAAELNRKPSEIAAALWRLAWLGRVTQDSLRTAWGPAPDPDRWTGSRSRTPWGVGRWSVVRPLRGEDPETTKAILRTLLDRYGVLCREWVEDDAVPLRWRDAYPALSRMEWAGEVDRGLFVSGLTGPQFAARGVAAALEASMGSMIGADRPVRIHVEDPVNVYGTRIPVIRADGRPYTVRRVSGQWLVLAGGRPVLAVEGRGERLIPLAELEPEELTATLATLVDLVQEVTGPASLRVRTWDGEPVAETAAGRALEQLGFMREDQSMILYRTYREAA